MDGTTPITLLKPNYSTNRYDESIEGTPIELERMAVRVQQSAGREMTVAESFVELKGMTEYRVRYDDELNGSVYDENGVLTSHNDADRICSDWQLRDGISNVLHEIIYVSEFRIDQGERWFQIGCREKLKND